MKKQIITLSVLSFLFAFKANAQTNKMAKFSGTTIPTGLAQSNIFDNGAFVGIGTVTPVTNLYLQTLTTGVKASAFSSFQISNTATNIASTTSVTKYGLDIQSTGTWTGTSANGVNVGLNINATGGSKNYAGLFNGGYVGIGTTTPVTKLHVSGNDNANYVVTVDNTATGGHSVYMGYNNGTARYGLQIVNGGNNATSYDLLVGTNKFLVRGDGNVGIGTTTPSQKLEVNGKLLLNSTAWDSHLEITRSGFGGKFMPDNSAGTLGLRLDLIGTGSNFCVMNGNVGIGTITPGSKLDVSGSITADGIPALILKRSSGTRYNTGEIQFTNSTGPAGFLGVQDNNIIALSSGQDLTIGANVVSFNTSTLTTFFGGNVGIGTTSPAAKVEIQKAPVEGSQINLLDLSTGPMSGQYIANGTGVTLRYLQSGNGNAASEYAAIHMIRNVDTPWKDQADIYFTVADWNGTATFQREVMRMKATGNVIIGTPPVPNSAYKLNVGGSIRANEVVVNTTGADFVFEDNYQLKKLEEVEAFVKQNKHLPEIAPANEMQNNGQGIGEMNTKLLQKVEEITLYMIEMNKQIQDLKAENAQLKANIKK